MMQTKFRYCEPFRQGSVDGLTSCITSFIILSSHSQGTKLNRNLFTSLLKINHPLHNLMDRLIDSRVCGDLFLATNLSVRNYS